MFKKILKLRFFTKYLQELYSNEKDVVVRFFVFHECKRRPTADCVGFRLLVRTDAMSSYVSEFNL